MLRSFFLLLLAPLSLVAERSAFGPSNQPPRLPDFVLELLPWPDARALAARGVPAESTNVAPAVFQAENWLREVLDPGSWPARFDPVCVAGESNRHDTIWFKWEAAGRRWMMGQTWQAVVMEIRPESRAAVTSIDDRIAADRELCRKIFSRTTRRSTGQGVMVPIASVNEKIIEYSFDAKNIRRIAATGQAFGRPKTMAEEGVSWPTDEEATAQDSATNVHWEKSWFAWQYWFRDVHWVSESDRVIIFFLKRQGGPPPFSIAGQPLRKWFSTEGFRHAVPDGERR